MIIDIYINQKSQTKHYRDFKYFIKSGSGYNKTTKNLLKKYKEFCIQSFSKLFFSNIFPIGIKTSGNCYITKNKGKKQIFLYS